MSDNVCRCGVDDKYCAACYSEVTAKLARAEAELATLRRRVFEHKQWLKADSQHAENQRLRQQNAELTKERDALARIVTATQEVLTYYPPLDHVQPGHPEHLVSQITYLCNMYAGNVHTLGLIVDQRDALAAALVKRKTCSKCGGTGRYLAYPPTIYCTDTKDEMDDAHRMAERKCPDCGVDPKAILSAHDAAITKPLVEALEPFRAACAILDALPESHRIKDTSPLQKELPGAWPTMGDLRKVSEALANWREKGTNAS